MLTPRTQCHTPARVRCCLLETAWGVEMGKVQPIHLYNLLAAWSSMRRAGDGCRCCLPWAPFNLSCSWLRPGAEATWRAILLLRRACVLRLRQA